MYLLLSEAIASTAVFDTTAIMPSIASVGSLGFAIWFAYYTTTVTLPNQQKEHRDERTQAQAAFAQTIKELVEEMKSARDAFDRWKSKE